MTYTIKILIVSLFSLVSVNCLAADVLFRVFTTPAERAMLDIGGKQDSTDDGSGNASTLKKTVQQVELNGIVNRSTQKDVVWINGKNTLKSPRTEEDIKFIRTENDGQTARISITGRGSVRLKPGQVYNNETGAIVDEYSVK